MEIPAALARQLGATHVISVYLPAPEQSTEPRNVFQVINRCFQMLQSRAEGDWRGESDLVIAPDVGSIDWNGFGNGEQLVAAGESAAWRALPQIQGWFTQARTGASPMRIAA
jgi:NTE family protein